MSSGNDPQLDYADPTTRQASAGRPLRSWLILLAVWMIGLAIWTVYLVLLVMLVIRVM
jgi:hypothetical protein